MVIDKFLHKFLKNASNTIHAKRLSALINAATTVANGANLTLTSIGRHLKNKTSQKHKIKAVDQLLANGKLHTERDQIYKTMIDTLIGSREQINVIVDWSPCPNKDNHLLRASLISKKNSILLYQEVHPGAKQANHKVHRQFLKKFKRLLPIGIDVTVVTDSGFKTPWFTEVEKCGWNYVGRVRGRICYTRDDGKNWKHCKDLFSQAKSKAMDIGGVLISKANKFESRFVLFKKRATKKRKGKKLKNEPKGTMEKKYRKSAREPWLLATSLKKIPVNCIVNLYKKRMKIEAEFRNTKDPRWGIGLSKSLTRNTQRLSILLLIGAIASFALWLLGLATELKGLHRQYQANTAKKRVLSLITLGLNILKQKNVIIGICDLQQAITYMQASGCYYTDENDRLDNF